MTDNQQAERKSSREADIGELREALEAMVYQFGYTGGVGNVPVLTAGGLSALELAFEVLGWADPHPMPNAACGEPGCSEWATCGTPTPDGYLHVCFEHFQKYQEATDHER